MGIAQEAYRGDCRGSPTDHQSLTPGGRQDSVLREGKGFERAMLADDQDTANIAADDSGSVADEPAADVGSDEDAAQ
jgi:hypothetical protein